MPTYSVEVVSKTGKNAGRGIKLQGFKDWFNAGKRMAGDFSSLKKGDQIECELDDNWINSFTLLGSSPKTESEPKPYANSSSQVSNRDAKITLGNAYNAVFAPVYSAHVKETSHEEAFTIAANACNQAAKNISEAI